MQEHWLRIDPGAKNKCHFCNSLLGLRYLYTCDQCGHLFCSDCSEWLIITGEERGYTAYTTPVWMNLDGGPLTRPYVRVCEVCINPGLTWEAWEEMRRKDEANGIE